MYEHHVTSVYCNLCWLRTGPTNLLRWAGEPLFLTITSSYALDSNFKSQFQLVLISPPWWRPVRWQYRKCHGTRAPCPRPSSLLPLKGTVRRLWAISGGTSLRGQVGLSLHSFITVTSLWSYVRGNWECMTGCRIYWRRLISENNL